MALEYNQKVYLKETNEPVVIKAVIYHQGNTTYRLSNGNVVSRASIITELPKKYKPAKQKKIKQEIEEVKTQEKAD